MNYNKVVLGYQLETNVKSFRNLFRSNRISNYNMPKLFYCSKHGQTFPSCFLRKYHETNTKLILKENMHCTNAKGSKMSWVLKVKV